MTFTWRFHTSGNDALMPVKRCFRGPMIDVEQVMSRSFQYMKEYDHLRAKFLRAVVSTDNLAVQTRETLLRVIDANTAAVFLRLYQQRGPLHVLICEKRNSKAIDDDLADDMVFFQNGARAFAHYGLPLTEIDVLMTALVSNSPVLRVAGMASVVLLAAFLEMDHS
jgi:hypothetical protein